jgi:cyclopropane fatty-acyl-phospholipid synthase-like methyltransferase
MTRLRDCVTFKRHDLAARYAARKIPMSTLLEAYLDEDLDIVDMDTFLDARASLVSYTLTRQHAQQLITRMVPEWAVHSLELDARLVRAHYDRGDDFFRAFLGERMVYTSGYFTDEHSLLEQSQDDKLDRVCQKLRLEPEQTLLDVGCGWGTLALHAAREYGVSATGVTLSKNQTAFGNARIADAGLAARARLECLDYRQIPQKKYDRIVSLEMVEHVGLKNLSRFFELLYERLEDHGLFLLQFAGLRRGGPLGVPPLGMRPEDMIWGLFMNKYVFPGADASPPLSVMLKAMERAGFDIHSVENISIHYALTIARWLQNWRENSALIRLTYGERWFRLWHLFLAWSARIGRQGNSECFQVLAHKNLDSFDRTIFLGPACATRGPTDRRVPSVHAAE